MKLLKSLFFRRLSIFVSLVLLIGVHTVFSQNRVVGYIPTYNNFPNSIFSVDLDILTHVDVAFVNPTNASGTIFMPNGLATVVNTAHAKDVKVLFSIAGAGANAALYGSILRNANNTNSFVNNLVQAVLANNLDGVDVDIEGDVLNGRDVTAAQYESFVIKLRNALHAQNKIMTAALGGWFLDQVTNTAAQSFDFIGMMSYDAYGTWSGAGPHSTYELALRDFNNWRAKGVPADQLVVGVPFYGYEWGGGAARALTFSQIISTYPGTQNQDQVNSGSRVIHYNGIPTIKRKTEFAKASTGGVMIWELTQDATGNNSLLKAIGEVMGPKNTNTNPPVPDNLALNKPVTSSSIEQETNNVASNLTDGDYSTRWSSAYADPQWVSVDLQDSYDLNRVKVTWEAASAKDYQIQVSSNGSIWNTIKSINNNVSLTNDITGLSGEGRYVRILGTSRNTVYGYSIFELEVYGDEVSAPYYGSPITLPGTVEAEDYDLGGNEVAYFDESNGNTFNSYRTDDVDIEVCNDIGGGYNVAGIGSGEWTIYTVEVTQNDLYNFNIRVATIANNKSFHIEMDGIDISGSIAIPNTNGWQNWQSVFVENVRLTPGVKRMKVVMDTDAFNINSITVQPASLVTAIDDINTTLTLNIYPNPASDNVFYKLQDGNNHEVKIYDMEGHLFFSKSGNDSNQINTSNIERGIYIIEIITQDKTYSERLIIE